MGIFGKEIERDNPFEDMVSLIAKNRAAIEAASITIDLLDLIITRRKNH